MSKKLIVATIAAGAVVALYGRTPSGRQRAVEHLTSIRHKLADWIKPADQVIEMNEVEELLDANVAEIFDDSDVPLDFLDSIQPQQD